MHDQRSLGHSDRVELNPARFSRGTGRVLDLLSVCLKLPADTPYWLSAVSSLVGVVVVVVVVPPPVLSGGSIGLGGGVDSNSKPALSSEDDENFFVEI